MAIPENMRNHSGDPAAEGTYNRSLRLEELESILNQVSAGIWAVDRDLRFVFAIGQVFNQPAVKKRLAAGPTVYDFFGVAPDAPEVTGYLEALKGTASSHRIGQQGHWLLMHAAPWRDSTGEIIGVIGAAVDIAAQVEAERARVDAERTFRLFMDSAPAFAFIVDDEDRITYVNEPYLKLHGRPASDFIGKLITEAHPPDLAERYNATSAQVREQDAALAIRSVAHRPDGTLQHADGFKFPFTDTDGHRYVGGVFVDITERIQSEERTARAEERFRLFMDHNPAIAFLADAEDRLVWANQTYLEQLGGTAEQVLGKHPDDIHGPGAAEQFAPSTRQVLTTLRPLRFQAAIQLASGTVRHLDGHKFPVPQPDGTVLIGGTFVDVSDRVAAEEERAAAEERFTTFMNLLPADAYSKDADLRYTWVNPQLLRTAGKKLEDMIGRTASEVWAPEKVEHEALEREIIADGRTRSCRTQTRLADGTFGEAFGYRFPLTGRDAVGGVFIDLTEETTAREMMRDREARLSTLFIRSPMGIAVTDLTGVFSEVNPAFATLLGTSPAELIGKRVRDITPAAEAERERKLLQELVTGRRSQYRIEKNLIRCDDASLVPVSVLLTLVRDGAGCPQTIIGMITPQPARRRGRTGNWSTEEIAILGLVADGSSDAQIAKILAMGESTVRLRLGALKRRLKAANRAHLVARAYQHGILPDQPPQSP
ncbi:PAS domain-containing protein [Streptomyces sp. NPDC002262]|uniref:PAS domain-containing protein n=1 Tax=Streptomyces sp. NPDC002262 TaxID=3154414 RepID=UPI003328EDA2